MTYFFPEFVFQVKQFQMKSDLVLGEMNYKWKSHFRLIKSMNNKGRFTYQKISWGKRTKILKTIIAHTHQSATQLIKIKQWSKLYTDFYIKCSTLT